MPRVTSKATATASRGPLGFARGELGHLVTLAEPADIHAEWNRIAEEPGRRDQLPMLPTSWPLVVLEKTKSQYEVVRKLLTAPDVDQVICALRLRSGSTSDAGREGELIFRYIHEASNCRKPVKRLWISSLTDDAIREGFRKLRDGREFDGLGDAARGNQSPSQPGLSAVRPSA